MGPPHHEESQSVHFDIADAKSLPRLDFFDTAQPLAQCFRQRALQRVHGRLGHVQRRLPQAQHLRQAVAMIVVFVSDENAVDAVNALLDSGQAGQGFALAQSGVNEEAVLSVSSKVIFPSCPTPVWTPLSRSLSPSAAPNKFSESSQSAPVASTK